MSKRPNGRPAKYNTPEELQSKIEDYFKSGYNLKRVIIGRGNNKQAVELPILTITGLCLFLGFCSRQSFYDLEKDKKFSYTIKKARTRIEQEYEEQLHVGNSGAIFALKNFGWKDTPAIQVNQYTQVWQGKINKAEGVDETGRIKDIRTQKQVA